MKNTRWTRRRRADVPGGGAPIGLSPGTGHSAARSSAHRPNRALRRAARAAALSVSATFALVGLVANAAAAPLPGLPGLPLLGTDTTSSASSQPSSPVSVPVMSTTGSMSGQPSTSTTSSTGDLPTAQIPTVGKFLSGDVLSGGVFTGGLFGDATTQTSVDPNQSGGAHSSGDTTHEGGGDACDFFLQHMWKNEDGIPLLGSNSHALTYHTDPSYKNLILSMASGAIGNSHMPVVDVYGGPLGWIPIFNPSHVRGHGTDYLTMATGCGGMGLPINTKTMAIDMSRLPTPEKVTNFVQKGMPSIPDPAKVLAPDYLYNTLQVAEIMNRLGPNTVFTPNEYLFFAGNNFDAMRLLWQTAFDKLDSGDPTAVLDVLKVTDNIQTLQSLGLPGLPGSSGNTLTGNLPIGGTTSPAPGSGTTGTLPTTSVPIVGPLVGGILGDASTNPGTPGTPAPGTPGGSISTSSPLPGLPGVDGILSPVTGLLGNQLPGLSPRPQPGPAPQPQPQPVPQPSMSISVGSPLVNGSAAGTAPGPNVTAGSPVTITVPVTNNGDVPVTGLSGNTSLGTLNCGSGRLAPGSTARCTVTTTARPGNNSAQFNFTVSGPNGTQVSKACRIFYTGTPAGAGKLTITGKPSVNGAVASNSPVTVQAGSRSTVTVPVANTGTAPIANLRGTSPNGGVTCNATTLAPGASTQCTIGFTAGTGAQTVKATFTGVDAAGNTSSAGFSLNYVTTGMCTCDPVASTTADTTAPSATAPSTSATATATGSTANSTTATGSAATGMTGTTANGTAGSTGSIDATATGSTATGSAATSTTGSTATDSTATGTTGSTGSPATGTTDSAADSTGSTAAHSPLSLLTATH